MDDRCRHERGHAGPIAVGRRQVPATSALQEVADHFAALGNTTRLKILYALTTGELCTCDLAQVVDLSVSAISHQLRLLRDRRLLSSRKEGKNVYHRLRDEHVADLLRTALAHQRERRRD